MGMEAPPAPTAGNKKQPPPALFLVRARSRASRVADLDDGAAAAAWSSSGPPDTPPRRSPVTVPFLWEEAPGKPKGGTGATVPAAAATTTPAAAAGDQVSAAKDAPLKLPPRLQRVATPSAAAGDHAASDAEAALPAPLKLPPRLQRVASARQQRQRDGSLSPKATLHGPYHYYYSCAGGKRPPARRTASGLAAFRRAPSFGASFFSRSGKSRVVGGGHLSGAAAPADAPWCSPAASSASSMSSSSSSLSASCFGDDHGQGGHRRPVDGREDGSSEEDECAVRITRFRRNRSFPSMTKSHLWASIRKSVKQITPWS
ncbi:unnamed protein product [Urochloa decumbens]|uniref:Uncharacterized protein n=1 Tax=Urochloa decumbens TaxID=240449 RepID=A0ABC8Z7C0_9POAL